MFSHFMYSVITFKWGWLLIAIIIYLVAKKAINATNKYINFKIEESYREDYSEDKIVGHLDYIIKEALDEYIIFNIHPRNLYYINSEMESRIIEELTSKVPDRISETLMYNLSIVYSSDYIGELIGRRIYMMVLNYVLEYNVNNNPDVITPGQKNQKK